MSLRGHRAAPRWTARAGFASGVVLGVLLLAPGTAGASFGLGLQDSGLSDQPTSPVLQKDYRVLTQVHGSTVRIGLPWSVVAPQGRSKPRDFDAANPADPGYRAWSQTVDVGVRAAAEHHAQIVLTISAAPTWAKAANPPAYMKQAGGDWQPDVGALGQFAHAAALRYSGHFPDPANPGSFLPHVRYWEIWNEENLPQDLGAPDLVQHYRSMLNAAYAAINGVDTGDKVAIGGLAPVSFETGSISPLKFAAGLMCLHRVGTRFLRSRSCPQPAHFDILAIHPYSLAATPTKRAYNYDDVLVGDMAKIGALLSAGDRLHTVLPRIRHTSWVTEWSWFTNPPQKVVGDSPLTAARYVAYSMYEMWRSGVSMVIWFVIQDPDLKASNTPQFVLGGGLYDVRGRAKPLLRAFEFPVIGSVAGGRGYVWGRAPVSRSAQVVVERASGRGWRYVTTVGTGSDGIFTARFRASGNGVYRARVLRGAASLGYDTHPIPPKRTHLVYSG